MKRLSFFLLSFIMPFLHGFSQSSSTSDFNIIRENFLNPPKDCWPHTRWWWPGNPVSKEGISWQLEQMKQHGITGVEQISMGPFYEKGTIPYLSEDFIVMLKHAVKEAKRLDLEVSLNFGGPSWIIGGEWVPEEDKSKDLVPTSRILEGPVKFSGPLPDSLIKTQRSWEHYTPKLDGNESLIAVMAGQLNSLGIIDPKSIVLLTDKVIDGQLSWNFPKGKWKLMAFWLKKNGNDNAVDHFNKGAMDRYCNYLGDIFYQAFGDEFGETIESMFVDSFELDNLASGIYWSTGLMEAFETYKGYDLTPYLPAIWWNMGEITPKIRYDVNEFLHHTGMEAFFKTFTSWCEAHQVKARIQPYGFATDNLQAAGITHIPEMEITAGEKDAADWFDTRIGPKKYVASGAHIYGRDIISVEAYTFIHWERYRATLEELKIASDNYLRSGGTKFYNHGFTYTPEKNIAPSRAMPYAAHIHPQNVWWEHYPQLASYIARSSYLLRQGSFAPDIAIYSPLANQWTKDVLNPRRWTRDFDWGDLGNLILSSGYDFDLLNDEALQNIAQIDNGNIKIKELSYKILLLPNIEAMPLETLKFIEQYVEQGGTVIALDRLPSSSTGFVEHSKRDLKVKSLVDQLFIKSDSNSKTRKKKVGEGQTYYIKMVIDRQIWWDTYSSALDPFLNTVRKHISPDFGIDFVKEGMRKNNGLAFQHRKVDESDVYFVTNIQEEQIDIPITFRTKNQNIEQWNPYNGTIKTIYHFKEQNDGITMPVRLAPHESAFFVFHPGSPDVHITHTNFSEIISVSAGKMSALTSQNGKHTASVVKNGQQKLLKADVLDVPAPLKVEGEWILEFEDLEVSETLQKPMSLYSWTDVTATRNYSGTCNYQIEVNLPSGYVHPQNHLTLDLGRVGNIACIQINGKAVGTHWIQGQKFDATPYLKEGKNILEIDVTNTLINRISALREHLPLEENIRERFGKSRVNPERIPREFGFEQLPASGLLGPVKIEVVKEVKILID